MTHKAPPPKLRPRYLWMSLRNWIKGYQFRPVQRFRCCGHTTPYAHATTCTYKDVVRGRFEDLERLARTRLTIRGPTGTLIDLPLSLAALTAQYSQTPFAVFVAPGNAPLSLSWIEKENLDLWGAITMSPGAILTLELNIPA